jgi:hypothetical protein
MRIDILEEHAEEANFCFGHRQHVLESLTIDRRFLSDLDERLAAHIDGLVVAQGEGLETARRLFRPDEPSTAFAAAAVALGWSAPQAHQALEEGLVAVESESFAAMLWAIRLWPDATAGSDLRVRWLASAEERLQAAALTALTASGQLQVEAIDRVLRQAPGPLLLKAALAGSTKLRHRQLLPLTAKFMDHEDSDVRAVAFEAVMMLDPSAARTVARRQLSGDESDPCSAVRALGLVGEPGDSGLLSSRLSSDQQPLLRLTLLALGNLGSDHAVQTLLDAAAGDDGRARVAGFALRRILGPAGKWVPRPGPVDVDDADEVDEVEDHRDQSWSLDEDLPLWSAEALVASWRGLKPQLGETARMREGLPYKPGAPARAPLSAPGPGPLGIQHDEALEEALWAPALVPRETRDLACVRPFAWRVPRVSAQGGGSRRA